MAVLEVARLQGGRPVAIFYPFGIPGLYAYVTWRHVTRELWFEMHNDTKLVNLGIYSLLLGLNLMSFDRDQFRPVDPPLCESGDGHLQGLERLGLHAAYDTLSKINPIFSGKVISWEICIL
jgi:hypothetical protein